MPARPAARLDGPAHRDRGVGPPVEGAADAGPGSPTAALWKVRTSAAPPARELAQPVIVRVMAWTTSTPRPDEAGAAARRRRTMPRRIPARLQREPRHGLDAGLARLGLEPVAADQAEMGDVAARAKPLDEPDDGVGAPRPPAIGDEVEDGEASSGPAGARAARRVRTRRGPPRRVRAADRRRSGARSVSPRACPPPPPRAPPRPDDPPSVARMARRQGGRDPRDGTRSPVTPSATTSGMPPMRLATTGTRVATACSKRLGHALGACGREHEAIHGGEKRGHVGAKPGEDHRVATPRSRASPSTHGRRTPSPTSSSRASGRRAWMRAKASRR